MNAINEGYARVLASPKYYKKGQIAPWFQLAEIKTAAVKVLFVKDVWSVWYLDEITSTKQKCKSCVLPNFSAFFYAQGNKSHPTDGNLKFQQ